MRRLRCIVAAAAIFAAAAAPLKAQACCAITGLEAKGQTAAAKVTATGKSFQFRVSDRRLFDSLRVGQPVYANFKANQVSLDGKAACCSILNGSTGSGTRPESGSNQASAKPTVASKEGQPQPTPEIKPTEDSTEGAIRGSTAARTPTSAPAPAGLACCAITSLDAKGGTVSARAPATGQVFSFAVTDRRLFDSLKVGQPVYANFKAGQVSLDGKTACCAIGNASATSGLPRPSSAPGSGPIPTAPLPPPAPTSTRAGGVNPPDVKVGGSPSVQDRVPQSKSQSEPGGGGGGGVTRTPTPPGPAHVDIVGRELPLEFVLKNRLSNVWASFTNSGVTLPADPAAADPQPDWLVDGQRRTPDTTEQIRPKGQVPTSGRKAWPQGSERTYNARFTLTSGLHEIRAVMPAQPTEISTGNNTTVFPVMAGAPDLVAEYDEGFINNGSLNSSYTRYRFWTENKGDIPSPPCRIRVTLSYRPVVQPPLNQEAVAWTPYDPVFDDIPSIIQARKSGYIYTQIWYPAQVTSGSVKPDEQYKWEVVVDENDAVTEDNKANNKLTVQKTHPGFDKLVMGKNPW